MPSSWTYLGVATVLAVTWLAMLSERPLFNPDEGRYAEIPREMLAGGDWIIPHLNGVAYIEKPPLQYWATALSLRIFGRHEFAARLYTALCALGTLVTVWLLARRMGTVDIAWRTTAVLSSMLLYVVLGQLLTLDMSLTFYVTVALAAFINAQLSDQPRPSRRWMLVAWGAVALGVLTKGLVAAAIPAAVLILYSMSSRDFSCWRRLELSRGLPLFLIVVVPWHWLAARRLPDFLEFFFVHEHLARYLTPSADREEAWWFFAAVLALGCMPWTVSALRVATTTRRRSPQGRFDAPFFLWLWAAFIAVFFSLSDSKLIPYVLPVLPAIALLIGALPAGVLRRDATFAALFSVALGIAALVLGEWGSRFIAASDRNQYFLSLGTPLVQIGALLGLTGGVVMFRGRDATRAAMILGAGWCLAGLLLMRAAALVSPIYSGVVLARAIQDVPPGAALYSVGTYDQTLPFYWQRTFTLVSYRGELDFGLRHDPGAELPDLPAFVRQWQTLAVGYAVMEKSMFDDLQDRGVPMREVARDIHRVLVARR